MRGLHNRRSSIKILGAALLLFAGLPTTAIAVDLIGLGRSAIQTADERLSTRLAGIRAALAATVAAPHPAHATAGGGGADLPTEHTADPHTEHIRGALLAGLPLFDLWAKPYGGYWERPRDGDIAGSKGHRYGLAVGAALPLGSHWSVGVVGGVDEAEIDYTNEEEVDATSVFGGVDARFHSDSGYFAGVAVVGGYVWNDVELPVLVDIANVIERF